MVSVLELVGFSVIVYWILSFSAGYVSGNFWKRNKAFSVFAGAAGTILSLAQGGRSITLHVVPIVIFAVGWYVGFIRTPRGN
jgi:hypothetical protein